MPLHYEFIAYIQVPPPKVTLTKTYSKRKGKIQYRIVAHTDLQKVSQCNLYLHLNRAENKENRSVVPKPNDRVERKSNNFFVFLKKNPFVCEI